MGTLSRVVLDRTGAEMATIHDGNLALDCYQPAAFGPNGTYGVDLARAEYDGVLTPRDKYALLAGKLTQAHPVIANILTARVTLFDAVAQAQSDVDAEQALEAQWPNPTGPQQTLINIAKVKAVNSIQAAQTARQNLADLIAALP